MGATGAGKSFVCVSNMNKTTYRFMTLVHKYSPWTTKKGSQRRFEILYHGTWCGEN